MGTEAIQVNSGAVVSSGELSACSTGKVTLVSVSTETPRVHLLQGLLSFGLGMMPRKIPVAFTATKIINCSLDVKRKLVIFCQGYFGPT